MRVRGLSLIAALLVVAGCALYSDVVIGPLIYNPANIQRGGDVPSMVRKFDYVNAVLSAPLVDARPNQSASELAALGSVEYMAGRFDSARRHLRAALDLQPFRTTHAQIAWDLSQVEYMSNNYAASLGWAKDASEHGMVVRPWHMSYLEALSNVEVYQVSGRTGVRMPMRADRPDVPRIDVSINGAKKVSAILDSGAVLSIMSRSLANAVPLTPLGEFEGTFTGLLGEPIPVRFALLDSLEIGGMRIGKVPVAIMPDDKMQFIVNGRKAFHMDFLLGAHLLKEFRIELNFRSGSLLLTRIPPAERKPVANQNLFFDQFRPAVRGTLNRRGWFVFLLDTGSEVTFLNERELEALPVNLAAPKIHNATLQGLGGATKHGSKLDDIEIGVDRWAGTFRTIPMYESGPYERTAGILGENYLKNFDVVIDFGRMRVDLAPIGVAGLVENSPVLNDIGGRQVPP